MSDTAVFFGNHKFKTPNSKENKVSSVFTGGKGCDSKLPSYPETGTDMNMATNHAGDTIYACSSYPGLTGQCYKLELRTTPHAWTPLADAPHEWATGTMEYVRDSLYWVLAKSVYRYDIPSKSSLSRTELPMSLATSFSSGDSWHDTSWELPYHQDSRDMSSDGEQFLFIGPGKDWGNNNQDPDLVVVDVISGAVTNVPLVCYPGQPRVLTGVVYIPNYKGKRGALVFGGSEDQRFDKPFDSMPCIEFYDVESGVSFLL